MFPSTSAKSWNDSHPRIDQRRSTAQALMARTDRCGTVLETEACRSGSDSETLNETERPSLFVAAWSAAARLPSVAMSGYRVAGSWDVAMNHDCAPAATRGVVRSEASLWLQCAEASPRLRSPGRGGGRLFPLSRQRPCIVALDQAVLPNASLETDNRSRITI